MKTFDYTIRDENGIHARPAGKLVKKAGEFQSEIKIVCGGKAADAKRIFSVMGLGVKQGDTIAVEAEGADEEAASEALLALLRESL